jgi:hypothetical protein
MNKQEIHEKFDDYKYAGKNVNDLKEYYEEAANPDVKLRDKKLRTLVDRGRQPRNMLGFRSTSPLPEDDKPKDLPFDESKFPDAMKEFAEIIAEIQSTIGITCTNWQEKFFLFDVLYIHYHVAFDPGLPYDHH